MNIEELNQREERLIEAEEKLKRKRRRDRILDLLVTVALLGITFYNSLMVRQANEICAKKYQDMILGEDKNRFLTNITNQQMLDKLKDMNVTCLTH